jgi:hypothetical protein
MTYVLWGGAAVVGAVVLYQLMMRANLKLVARYMSWIIGGIVALLTALLLVRGQIGIASVTGYVAFMILRFGRIGPWSFESYEVGEDNESAVKSRYISMTLDHDTGAVEGRVVAGGFKGSNLMDLDEEQTRLLLAEVSTDPDSLALLETWLDRNRAGWREHFEHAAWSETATVQPTSVQSPRLCADCHSPRAITTCGRWPAVRSGPRISRRVAIASVDIVSASGAPEYQCQTSAESTRCQRPAGPPSSR